MKRFKIDPETMIRLGLLGTRCRARRDELGWDQKEAARRMRVPRYRIDGIEDGSGRETSQKEIRVYIRILGIETWFGEWLHSNRKTFETLPLNPTRETPWAKRLKF
jgi:transcriptional regulator with XRE-family HTH domain